MSVENYRFNHANKGVNWFQFFFSQPITQVDGSRLFSITIFMKITFDCFENYDFPISLLTSLLMTSLIIIIGWRYMSYEDILKFKMNAFSIFFFFFKLGMYNNLTANKSNFFLFKFTKEWFLKIIWLRKS